MATSELRGIAPPAGVGVERLALHQEAVGIENRMVAHRDAVMHEGTGPDRAAAPNPNVSRLEPALLERMRLQHRALVNVRVIADLRQRALGDGAAAVEHLGADLHA